MDGCQFMQAQTSILPARVNRANLLPTELEAEARDQPPCTVRLQSDCCCYFAARRVKSKDHSSTVGSSCRSAHQSLRWALSCMTHPRRFAAAVHHPALHRSFRPCGREVHAGADVHPAGPCQPGQPAAHRAGGRGPRAGSAVSLHRGCRYFPPLTAKPPFSALVFL